MRWRLCFAKTGAAALLGHLDLIRELPRVVRRAGVKTAYSEGFHPKPEMSYGPALSLGIASLDEYVDAKLIDAPNAEELVARLNRAAAGGIEFRAATVLDANDPGITRIITGARYVIGLADVTLNELGGPGALAERLASFLALGECKLRREINGVGKWVDVRAFVRSLELGGDEARALLARAKIVGRVVPLELEVTISQNGAAKISEVIQAALGDSRFPHVAVRTALLAGASVPLDLAAHRKASSANVAAPTA